MKKLIGLLLLAAISFGSAQAQKKNDKKESKKENKKEVFFVPEVEGPEIKFEKTVHDYGQITKGADGNCEFTFQNIGSEPLILQNVVSSCGCTVPSWPREPIAPGETSSIKVKYDTNRMGSINKGITVTTNGKTERIVLRISGNVVNAEAQVVAPTN